MDGKESGLSERAKLGRQKQYDFFRTTKSAWEFQLIKANMTNWEDWLHLIEKLPYIYRLERLYQIDRMG